MKKQIKECMYGQRLLRTGQRFGLPIAFCFGFYRGWSCKSSYNRYTGTFYPLFEEEDLLVTKVMFRLSGATWNGLIYCTPLGLPAYYRMLGRWEIAWYKKDPYDYPEMFTEFFGYSTLPSLFKKETR